MKFLVAILLVLCACKSPIGVPTLEKRVVAANYEGWYAAGLPEIDEERVRTDLFEVQLPKTAAEFDAACYPATTKQANGCFRWFLTQHRAMGLYSIQYPAAIVDPTIAVEYNLEHLAIHELLHGLVDRTLVRSRLDPYDRGHTDRRVWAGTAKDPHPESAEERAWKAIAPNETKRPDILPVRASGRYPICAGL